VISALRRTNEIDTSLTLFGHRARSSIEWWRPRPRVFPRPLNQFLVSRRSDRRRITGGNYRPGWRPSKRKANEVESIYKEQMAEALTLRRRRVVRSHPKRSHAHQMPTLLARIVPRLPRQDDSNQPPSAVLSMVRLVRKAERPSQWNGWTHNLIDARTPEPWGTTSCGFQASQGSSNAFGYSPDEDAGARPARGIRSERQHKSRKRDNPHRLLPITMDQIRKTIPDGLPTGV